MRIVLDTNVLLSAWITPGVCRELYAAVTDRHELVLSQAIIDEFQAKLVSKKFGQDPVIVAQAMARISLDARWVEPVDLVRVCRDPDDDVILATARAGQCDCLATGDEDLLVLHPYAGIRILQPRALLREIEAIQ